MARSSKFALFQSVVAPEVLLKRLVLEVGRAHPSRMRLSYAQRAISPVARSLREANCHGFGVWK